MEISTIVMLVSSIGFILMGLIILKSKKIREFLVNSYAYKDTDKFINVNGKWNVGIGIIGIILAGLNQIFVQQSKYIIIIFILIITVLSFIQSQKSKKYRIY